MDSTSSRVRAMAGSRDDDDARSNYPKHHPSAIGFPSCWDHEMSCCLAEFDAFDGVDHRVTIRKLKDKFPLLRRHAIPIDMMERAVEWIHMNPIFNRSCRAGVAERITQLQERGIVVAGELPDEAHPLPSPTIQYKSDLELFGPGDEIPMTGRLAPGYSYVSDEEENLAENVSSMHVGDDNDGDLSPLPRQVQIAGVYRDALTLTDITNDRNRSHIGAVPFGGPYNLEESSSSRAPVEEKTPPTIKQRRAAKRREEKEEK